MKKRGYALPLSLCVAGVTLMLGLSAAQMTNRDMSLANHQYYQERARQAADFGLEYCVSHQVKPGTVLQVPSQSKTHPFDSVAVVMYSHGVAGSPIQVPKGFEYWVAEGRARQHANASPLASVRVGALVRYGLAAGSSGAQVRSLFVNSPRPVDFQVMDGLARRPVLGESVCASEYDGAGSYLPFPGQTDAIQLGAVGAFGGSFRVPRGVDQSVVRFTSTLGNPIPVAQDGGPINIPTFTPPAGLPDLGTRHLPNNFSGLLPAGRYLWLEIPADANVGLKGTYQFDRLTLSSGVSAGQGGTLKVARFDSARVFVSGIDLGSGSLGLTNDNPSAQSFRFTLKAVRPRADGVSPPLLNFKLPAGGGVALVADGHRVSLASDASRQIRGAFSTNALELKFPAAAQGLVRNPVFVYDVSASTARRASRSGPLGSGNDGDGGGDGRNGGNTGIAGIAGNADGSNGDGGYQGGIETSGTGNGSLNPAGHPILARPAGLEPMILSRQPL